MGFNSPSAHYNHRFMEDFEMARKQAKEIRKNISFWDLNLGLKLAAVGGMITTIVVAVKILFLIAVFVGLLAFGLIHLFGF